MSATAEPARSRSRRITLNLLKNLTLREVRSEYKRTALGRAWSLINPLAQITIYGIVFGLLFRAQPDPGINSGINIFALWLGIGIVTWGFINIGIREAMQSFLGYQGLLKKVSLPRWTLPASKVLARAITYLTEIAVVAVICGIIGGWEIILRIWMLVPLIALTTVFVYGIGLVLAIGIVYFRDIEHFWGILTQVFFYASGIMIPRSTIETVQVETLNAGGYTFLGGPVPLLQLFEANPVYQFLTAYRRVLYDFAFPEWQLLLSLTLWSAGTLIVGLFVYTRYQARIVEEL
ncbi:ABC transporter permease [Agrococcus sp. ARC_14]|uniref:ABC transporter permease n=1 Tax=Agrococcus sp. ARC_14 TaxID=2919927 RepID=UPI001F056FDD|nr:ABC transporter permease [Agrococcus sp. ARC_14]MCH1882334.1 ABC transporter permease [Agrococcus sp. ARC_14]